MNPDHSLLPFKDFYYCSHIPLKSNTTNSQSSEQFNPHNLYLNIATHNVRGFGKASKRQICKIIVSTMIYPLPALLKLKSLTNLSSHSAITICIHITGQILIAQLRVLQL